MSRTKYQTLQREHVARKRHRCGWDCGDPIEPGTRYVKSTLPPFTEPYEDSPHWQTHALHGVSMYDCPRYKNREVSG